MSAPEQAPPSRRGLLAASAAAGLVVLTGCGTAPSSRPDDPKPAGSSAASPGREPSRSPSPRRTRKRKRPQLPRGGRELFPKYRLVGYCGLPGAPALGRLGTGDPGEQVSAMEKTARDYAGGREPLPVLELLATVANPTPGPDGTYRTRTPGKTIRRFHELARERDALLLLNVQPGRAAALDEVRALSEWLEHPHVGVALDPEWDMGPGQTPGETFGRISGDELNAVAGYLSELVDEHDLPDKPLVFHQVATSVVSDEKALRPADGVTLIKSADGIGSPELKRGTWRRLVDDMPECLHTGFKLFYEEDAQGSRLMKPPEVLKLRPEPEYVMYE
ncbi:hypothetical protein [Streptomyces winkii]|uniref:hypothetical protein n=1 Tax=Streptomyces winkii TaxID=3051178 RepID=UPI0028D6AEB0|nr:hypothetical protein [Streptomyces sp. DSM 40971]